MKSWDQVTKDASDFISFLEQGNFFNKPFLLSGDYKIITDAKVCINYATNDDFDTFDEWETVTDTPNVFPDDEEYSLKAGSDLLPIGLGYSEHLTYFIDPSFKFYGGYDDYFCKIGDSVNSFFNNIFYEKNFIQL
ncbi:hypothetical protein [Acinetobacter baumannii]|uniref:hypothetical protein n=1 Tax=Acinetobacter baumannii TaxID=470 RepID=UPI00244BC968|nr:hypothetical protein [Acinetobacter baumannii]MDH2588506.1 hypothetical protein [Acinetobacter baumannii]